MAGLAGLGLELERVNLKQVPADLAGADGLVCAVRLRCEDNPGGTHVGRSPPGRTDNQAKDVALGSYAARWNPGSATFPVQYADFNVDDHKWPRLAFSIFCNPVLGGSPGKGKPLCTAQMTLLEFMACGLDSHEIELTAGGEVMGSILVRRRVSSSWQLREPSIQSASELATLSRVFMAADLDGNGLLDWLEMQVATRVLQFSTFVREVGQDDTPESSVAILHAITENFDRTRTFSLSWTDFVGFFNKMGHSSVGDAELTLSQHDVVRQMGQTQLGVLICSLKHAQLCLSILELGRSMFTDQTRLNKPMTLNSLMQVAYSVFAVGRVTLMLLFGFSYAPSWASYPKRRK
jgi:hypothetical protein